MSTTYAIFLIVNTEGLRKRWPQLWQSENECMPVCQSVRMILKKCWKPAGQMREQGVAPEAAKFGGKKISRTKGGNPLLPPGEDHIPRSRAGCSDAWLSGRVASGVLEAHGFSFLEVLCR